MRSRFVAAKSGAFAHLCRSVVGLDARLATKRIRDFECGDLVTIASGGSASLHYFVRDSHRHARDAEHTYPSHSLVFTDAGEWGYHGPDSKTTVDERSIVAGTGLGNYACAHPPDLFNECFVVALSNDAFGDEGAGLFSKSVLTMTPDMLAHRRAILAAIDEPEILEGLTFSLFDIVAQAAARGNAGFGIDVRMTYAKRVMAEACRLPVSVADIARELHLSRYTFTRRFLAHEGTTPHAFMTSVRIARAKEMLRTTALSVEDIALANGFGSIAHFSHAFRRLEAMTPTAFRRLSAQ